MAQMPEGWRTNARPAPPPRSKAETTGFHDWTDRLNIIDKMVACIMRMLGEITHTD